MDKIKGDQKRGGIKRGRSSFFSTDQKQHVLFVVSKKIKRVVAVVSPLSALLSLIGMGAIVDRASYPGDDHPGFETTFPANIRYLPKAKKRYLEFLQCA